MTPDLTTDSAGRRSRALRLLLAAIAAIALCAPAMASANTPIAGPTQIEIPDADTILTPTTNYLVVTVAFRGGFTTPASDPDLTTSFLADDIRHGVNPWFTTISNGRFNGGTTTRIGPVKIQPTRQVCSDGWKSEVKNLAEAEVRKQRVEPRSFQAAIYYFKNIPGCIFSGHGWRPGTGNNAVLLNGYSDVRVLGHELGHNLGLGHAGAQFCSDGRGTRMTLNFLLSGSCTQEVYGDIYSAMGSVLYPFSYSAAQLVQLGWLPGQVKTIPADTERSQTVFLTPLEDAAQTGTKAIHLAGDRLWLEYRRVDAIQGLSMNSGLLVRAAVPAQDPDEPNPAPFLLDMSPLDGDYARQPANSLWHPEMAVGQTWVNPQGNMKITLNSANALGASVTIESKVVYKTVPDVRGMTTTGASNAIVAAGLTRGVVGKVADPLCEDLNRVITQTPAPGTRIVEGFSVSYSYGVTPLNGCPDQRQ